MVRAFVAVELPEELKRSLLSSLPEMRGVRALDERVVHITLAFLGDVERGRLGALEERLDAIRLYPFEVSFRGAGLIGSHGHAVLHASVETGADALSTLSSAVREACSASGIALEDRRFLPHMTVGRISDLSKCDSKLREFVKASLNRLAGSFMCGSFWLESSVLTPSGPFYTRLHEVRLRGWQ